MKTRTSDNKKAGATGIEPMIPGLTTAPLEPHHHYSAEELSMAVATSCVCALVVGFIVGFLMSKRCSCSSRDDDNPYHVPYLNQLVQFNLNLCLVCDIQRLTTHNQPFSSVKKASIQFIFNFIFKCRTCQCSKMTLDSKASRR